MVLSEPVISVIRRELRRIKDGLKVSNEEIEDLVANEVLKRDLVESEAAKEAQKNLQKLTKRRARAKPKTEQPPASATLTPTGGQ